MRTLFQRLLSFGAFSLIAAISPLLVLPAIAARSTPEEWASLLVGQVIGSFGGTIVLFGWGLRGQARLVATPESANRSVLYAESLRARFAVFAVVAPIAVAVTLLISGSGGAIAAGLMALAMVTYGFSLSWYSIGVGRASLGAVYESIPRLAAAVAAAIIISITGFVPLYPILLIVASLAGLLWFQRVEFGRFLPRGNPEVLLRDLLRPDLKAAATSMLGAGYAAAPLPLAVAMFGAEAAGMASGDRLYRYGLLALAALSAGTHSWSLGESGAARAKRQWVSLALHACVGVIGAVAFAVFAPPVSEVLFGPELAVDALTSALYAVAFLAVSTSTSLVRNLLVPAGRDGVVLGATGATVVLGLSAMLGFGIWLGVDGVVLGLAVSEALSLALIVPSSLRHLKRPREGPPGGVA